MAVHNQYARIAWALKDDELRRLHAEGKSASDCARLLGCTRNAIIGRWHRLDLRQAARLPVSKPVAPPRATSEALLRERSRQREQARATIPRGLPPMADATPQAERFAEGFKGQTGRVALLGLTAEMCRFPIDQADGAVRFCGAAAPEGSSWCASHAARVFDRR